MFRGPSSAAIVALVACGGAGQPAGSARPPVCPLDRIVQISSQEDIAQVAGCTALRGLLIRTGAPLDLAPLHTLETVSGDLQVGPTVALEELGFNRLREVGGSIQIESNQLLRGVFLPRLESAGRISIAANSSLYTIAAPRLATVHGAFVIAELGLLEILDLSALVTVGKDLVIADNPRLGLVELAALSSVLDIRIEGNRALSAEQVEAVKARARPPKPDERHP